MASGISKTDFLIGKQYSEAKFNYWIAKWKANRVAGDGMGFREIGLSEVALDKVLEIETSSGYRISVFSCVCSGCTPSQWSRKGISKPCRMELRPPFTIVIINHLKNGEVGAAMGSIRGFA